jgi:hypothetical protein
MDAMSGTELASELVAKSLLHCLMTVGKRLVVRRVVMSGLPTAAA